MFVKISSRFQNSHLYFSTNRNMYSSNRFADIADAAFTGIYGLQKRSEFDNQPRNHSL